MVVLLVIYKPLYWPIAHWRFPIATCCTDHAVNVCTSNCSVTNHIFFMHLSLDQFLFSWLPLKAALTDIDSVFVVLRPECNSINIVYCSVHWGSFHTILDNWAAGTKTGAPDRALLFTNRIGDFTGISATEITCAAPILKVERDRISGRFLPFLVAVWTGIRIEAEVNKQERGLEPIETEVYIQKWAWDLNDAPNHFDQPLGYDGRCVLTICSSSVSFSGKYCCRSYVP